MNNLATLPDEVAAVTAHIARLSTARARNVVAALDRGERLPGEADVCRSPIDSIQYQLGYLRGLVLGMVDDVERALGVES